MAHHAHLGRCGGHGSVDAEFFVVGLDGGDAFLALDTAQAPPWQRPLAEVVFDLLGEVAIADIALLVVEEPVVAHLVRDGVGELLELNYGRGPPAIAANLLGLVAKVGYEAVAR